MIPKGRKNTKNWWISALKISFLLAWTKLDLEIWRNLSQHLIVIKFLILFLGTHSGSTRYRAQRDNEIYSKTASSFNKSNQPKVHFEIQSGEMLN